MMRALLPALLATLAQTGHAANTSLELPRDGWASWEVPAVAEAPAWCCFDRDNTTTACRLTGTNGFYGGRDGQTTDALRVYARFDDGRLERLRTFAAACPVQSSDPIANLGTVDGDASARWLLEQLSSDDALVRHLSSDVMQALAMHGGDVAHAALENVARSHPRQKYRKDAVFWLAHMRGRPGADAVTTIMFNDADSKVRVHAAFAITQSKSPQIAADLIRLGTSDTDAHVRAQAWFWLAHEGAPETEQAIAAVLRTEKDHEVRHQAIFALSQLPDDRATPALIAVAEQTSLPREDRQRAIFWLGHEGSAAALAYLDRIVTSATPAHQSR